MFIILLSLIILTIIMGIKIFIISKSEIYAKRRYMLYIKSINIIFLWPIIFLLAVFKDIYDEVLKPTIVGIIDEFSKYGKFYKYLLLLWIINLFLLTIYFL